MYGMFLSLNRYCNHEPNNNNNNILPALFERKTITSVIPTWFLPISIIFNHIIEKAESKYCPRDVNFQIITNIYYSKCEIIASGNPLLYPCCEHTYPQFCLAWILKQKYILVSIGTNLEVKYRNTHLSIGTNLGAECRKIITLQYAPRLN